MPHAELHTLRHSAASVMLTRGVPLKVVCEILGASSIAITGDIYGHVAPDVARQAMDTSATPSTGSPSRQHTERPSLPVTLEPATRQAPKASTRRSQQRPAASSGSCVAGEMTP
jgi:Phage integrase family